MPKVEGKKRTGKVIPRPNRPFVQEQWLPATLLAVDPGGEHVGVSWWVAAEPPTDHEGGQGWYCKWSAEMQPDQFMGFLARELLSGTIDIVVYESFRLMADRAMQQVGSDMPTSQLIGVIKWLAGGLAQAKARWPAPEVELHEQAPSIKKPTDSIRRSKGLGFQAKRMGVSGDHATDSELHALYHIMNTRKDRVFEPSEGASGGSADDIV